MDSARRRELKSAYKSRPVIGGVCCIRCSGNQRTFLQATRDIESLKKRFDFAIAIGGCPDPTMRGEWEKYGTESFSFTVLEELKKGENQTDQEFSDDIDVLYEIWLEKIKEGGE